MYYLTFWCFLATAMMFSHQQVAAFDRLKIASPSADKRAEVFQRLRGLPKGYSTDSLDGADPDGIFNHCECTTAIHTNCVCKGLIATGVTASMEMKYEADKEAVDVIVRCNGDELLALGDLNPYAAKHVCDIESKCGGADVVICFRLYLMTSADEEGVPPKGCNDVTVTINGGQKKVYTECMPNPPS